MEDILTQPWHWSFSGFMIVIVMFLLIHFGQRFGVSSSFRAICSIAGAGKLAEYFRYDWKSHDWLLLFVIGAIIGGFLSQQFMANPLPVAINQQTVQDLSALGIHQNAAAIIGCCRRLFYRWSSDDTLNITNHLNSIIMQKLVFLLIGILFGITMTKSEAISWFRIQEMFRFQGFHMYGIIGVAVILGAGLHFWMQRSAYKRNDGTQVQFQDKPKTYTANIIGGTIFGLGWAMTGACPGPLYVLIGNGVYVVIAVIISALFGAFVYGMIRSKLPH